MNGYIYIVIHDDDYLYGAFHSLEKAVEYLRNAILEYGIPEMLADDYMYEHFTIKECEVLD